MDRRAGRPHLYAFAFVTAMFVAAPLVAAPYDPPASYYVTATGVGSALKSQLHDIIRGHSAFSYDALRSILQVTDRDPDNPDHILLVYDRVSLDVSNLNSSGVPGWDPNLWNREHTWPRSRGVGTSGPDNTDLHHLRPSTPSINNSRNNLNFGGEFGQPFGRITDQANTVWYPGDADAGMIARQEFYMAVRYEGGESATEDLELYPGNPAESLGLGDLNRMLEWHFAAPPDEFELGRNHIIYSQYQGNRNPFVDRPEFAWSVFVDQANDSQILIDGGEVLLAGASALNLDLGAVLVGANLPAEQGVTLVKSGIDGTYYQVTTTGAATSSIQGRFNAFRTDGMDNVELLVGLDGSTSTAGLKTGAVTIDNLDITTGGGAGRGANDGNDVIQLEWAVLDHATASFDDVSWLGSLELDFGTIPVGSAVAPLEFSIHNLVETAGYTAALELDSITAIGDTTAFGTNLAPFWGTDALPAGDSFWFSAMPDTTSLGDFAATFELSLSDEDLPGSLSQSLTLTLLANVVSATLEGDFNGDLVVNAADYVVWRNNASGEYTQDDYFVWKANFGASAAGTQLAAVPEPSTAWSLFICLTMLLARRGHRVPTVGHGSGLRQLSRLPALRLRLTRSCREVRARHLRR